MKRRSSRSAVAHVWQDLSATFQLAAVTIPTSVTLQSFEAPAPAAGMGFMPPQDIIIDRIVGSFHVTVSTTSSWSLGLLVADTGWAVGVSLAADADKRLLWHETYLAFGLTLWNNPSGVLQTVTGALGVGAPVQCPERLGRVDITPRVRLSRNRSLYLVAWENVNGANLTVTCYDMRMLWHRARGQ